MTQQGPATARGQVEVLPWSHCEGTSWKQLAMTSSLGLATPGGSPGLTHVCSLFPGHYGKVAGACTLKGEGKHTPSRKGFLVAEES